MHRSFLLSVLCSLVLFGGCSKGPEGVDLIPVKERLKAPEVRGHFINASSGLTLSSLKGKVVVLDFWATWCAPCRMEIPSLIKMVERYRSSGLELWGLSIEGENGKPDSYFQQFISDSGINYPVGLPGSDTIQAYGINPIPATFFIDKNGRVALSLVGLHGEDEIDGAIRKLLAE